MKTCQNVYGFGQGNNLPTTIWRAQTADGRRLSPDDHNDDDDGHDDGPS